MILEFINSGKNLKTHTRQSSFLNLMGWVFYLKMVIAIRILLIKKENGKFTTHPSLKTIKMTKQESLSITWSNH